MKAADLPIYKDTYDLLQQVIRLVRNFPKDLKPSIGKKLYEEVFDMVLHIYRANVARTGRQKLVQVVLESIQIVQLTLRLCRDLALISVRQFSNTLEVTDSIGRQAYGWWRSA